MLKTRQIQITSWVPVLSYIVLRPYGLEAPFVVVYVVRALVHGRVRDGIVWALISKLLRVGLGKFFLVVEADVLPIDELIKPRGVYLRSLRPTEGAFHRLVPQYIRHARPLLLSHLQLRIFVIQPCGRVPEHFLERPSR